MLADACDDEFRLTDQSRLITSSPLNEDAVRCCCVPCLRRADRRLPLSRGRGHGVRGALKPCTTMEPAKMLKLACRGGPFQSECVPYQDAGQ